MFIFSSKSKFLQEPGTTSPSDEKKEDANSEVKGAEAGEDASEDGMSDEGFVEIPLEIRRMLRDAGVEGAMEWDGNPAKEPLRDYVEERLKNVSAKHCLDFLVPLVVLLPMPSTTNLCKSWLTWAFQNRNWKGVDLSYLLPNTQYLDA